MNKLPDYSIHLRRLRGDETIAEMAEKTGLSASAIGMYETGRRVPKDPIKIILANYFSKTVQEIFFDNQSHT